MKIDIYLIWWRIMKSELPFGPLKYASSGTRRFGAQPCPFSSRLVWEFYAVTSGRIGPVFKGDESPILKSEMLWLIPPTLDHGWTGDGKRPAHVVVFHFHDVPSELVQLTKEESYIEVPLSSIDKSLLKRLAKESLPWLWQPDDNLEFFSLRLIMDLTILIMKKRVTQNSTLTSSLAKVEAAEKWYASHLTAHPSLTDMACRTGTTHGNLRRYFMKERNCSPKEAMRRIQMETAARFLSTSNWKLEVVANECGFLHMSSFCTAFKDFYGKTPSEFRTKHEAVKK